MLVLSRRNGERIKIGEDVWITVLHTSSGRVKLGIDAPREVSVTRDDSREPVQRENIEPAIAVSAGVVTTKSA